MGNYIKHFGRVHYSEYPFRHPHTNFAVEEAYYWEQLPEWIAGGLDGWRVAIRGREVVGMWPESSDSFRRMEVLREQGPVSYHRIQEWWKVLVGITPFTVVGRSDPPKPSE